MARSVLVVWWCGCGGGGGLWDPKVCVPEMALRILSVSFLCSNPMIFFLGGKGSRGGGGGRPYQKKYSNSGLVQAEAEAAAVVTETLGYTCVCSCWSCARIPSFKSVTKTCSNSEYMCAPVSTETALCDGSDGKHSPTGHHSANLLLVFCGPCNMPAYICVC